MRTVQVAATQFSNTGDINSNLDKAEKLVRNAHNQGANIILLQELFATLYFCQAQDSAYRALAYPTEESPVVKRFAAVAKELGVVLPVSFFERANNAFYNSIAIIDADGTILGVYRKSHIPDGPGYQEKFYFNPGDTGFKVFSTRYGKIGVAICWDQWFPECARAMVLQGAEILMYPTAIGTEPEDPELNSFPHWTRVQQGHAAANMVPVVASNRVGVETVGGSTITFHGGSFIAGPTGQLVAQVGRAADQPSADVMPHQVEGIVVVEFDLDALAELRTAWGIFRDRRIDLYKPLLTHDGKTGL